MPKQPVKKTLAKKPKSDLTPQFPSKGGTCQHKGLCFKVILFNYKQGDFAGKDTFHYPDEASAVMFAMRQSRDLPCRAVVSVDGTAICQFGPRGYDVAKARHALLDQNDLSAAHHALYAQVNQARREGSNPPKKKVLKKR